MARRYTAEEKQFLISVIPGHTHAEAAALFNATFEYQVSAEKVHSFSTNNKVFVGRYLNLEQQQFLKDNGAGNDSATLATLFNKRFGTDYSAKKIETVRYKYGAVSGLKTRVPNSGRFQKGCVSHNKGLRQCNFMSSDAIERSAATRFQKGHTPKNHKPVGSTRIDTDGYVMIKTAEPRTWRQLQRVNWETAHGKVPAGKMIIFLDGDKTNCEISNLSCISQSVNVRLNQNNLRADNAVITKTAITLAEVIAKATSRKVAQ